MSEFIRYAPPTELQKQKPFQVATYSMWKETEDLRDKQEYWYRKCFWNKRRIKDTSKKAWSMFRNPFPGDYIVACCSQTFELIVIWDWWFFTLSIVWRVLLNLHDSSLQVPALFLVGGGVEETEYFPSFQLLVRKQAHWARVSVWTYDKLQSPISICLNWESWLLGHSLQPGSVSQLYCTRKLTQDGDISSNLRGTYFCASFTPNQLGMPPIKKTRRRDISL